MTTVITGDGITLPAGTATKEPLRLQSGTLLTTPVPGAIEYDGVMYYMTPVADRHAIMGTLGGITATATVENTTTETVIYTGVIGAGELHEGQVIRTRLLGRYETANPAHTFTARFKVAGVTVLSVSSVGGSVTDAPLDFEFVFTVRSDGVSGTLWGFLEAILNNVQNDQPGTGTTAVDTTLAANVTVTIEWSVANPNNRVHIDQAHVVFIG